MKDDLDFRLRSAIWLQAIRDLTDEAADTIQKLTHRYDVALQRINDMQAELEHLRREVNR